MDSQDKRYQVFVSSTFDDLGSERREVMQALLEMDCIPAGMELFPAADEVAWKLITRVIDQSDFYVLVIGGRYGSLHSSGVGFTEMEYDYAVTAGKQILPFLHEHQDQIPLGKSETDTVARAKLAEFQSKVKIAHHCKFWTGSEDLGGKVSRALIQAIKATSPVGWVRGDQAKTVEDLTRLTDLQSKVAQLEAEKRRLQTLYDEMSVTAVKSADARPAFVVRFESFCRKIDVEWTAEKEVSIQDPDDIAGILGRVRQELIEFSAALDDDQHWSLRDAVTRSLTRVIDCIRSNPFKSLSSVDRQQWANQTDQAMRELENILQQCKDQRWP